jgi:hypothetical protein
MMSTRRSIAPSVRRNLVAFAVTRDLIAPAVKRDLVAFAVKRDYSRYLNTVNKFYYDDDYPPDRFINWGQRNIQPFDSPWGTDSQTPFSDLD